MVRGARLVAARAPDRAAGKAQAGKSVLLIAPTGAGKTLAGFMPTLTDLADRPKRKPGEARRGIHTLYISPLKALAVDIERNLDEAGRRDGPAGDDGDAHRRHAGAQAPAPEARAARHIAHHARAARAADRDVGREALLRGSALRRLRRAAFAGDLEARPSAVARAGAAARHRARPAGDRPVGDRRRSGRAAPLAGARRSRRATWPS